MMKDRKLHDCFVLQRPNKYISMQLSNLLYANYLVVDTLGISHKYENHYSRCSLFINCRKTGLTMRLTRKDGTSHAGTSLHCFYPVKSRLPVVAMQITCSTADDSHRVCFELNQTDTTGGSFLERRGGCCNESSL